MPASARAVARRSRPNPGTARGAEGRERAVRGSGGKPNALTLSVSALSDQETAQLLSSLLERAVLPADLQASLLSRPGGNSLYTEHFARLLAETGSSDACRCARRPRAKRCSPRQPEPPQRRKAVSALPRAAQSGIPAPSSGRAIIPSAASTLAAMPARAPLSQTVTTGLPFSSSPR